MGVKPFLIFLLLVAAVAARAQAPDTVLRGSTIEIIQSYKPRVKQSPKPEWVPALPPVDTGRAGLNYDVPQQTLYFPYNAKPLQPLVLGKNTDLPPLANYIKAGGGNLSTIFLDAGIGGFYGDGYESVIHLHHMSQKGQIKYQQSSLSGLEAEGVLHRAKNDLRAAVAAERNQYNYYGYDHSLFDYKKDSVKQTYTTVRLTADLKKKMDSFDVFGYDPSINASLYNARFKTMETTVGFNLPTNYKVDSNLDLLLGLSGALTYYKSDSFYTNNNYIELLPGVDLHNTALYYGHALCGLAMGKGNNFYVLPDILAAYKLPATKFTFSLGWQASLRQNTYEQLTTENPYLYSIYPVVQSRRDELFAGVHAGVGNHLTFSLRGSWWSFKDLPTFVNGDMLTDQKQFYVLYDNVNALSLQAGARYQVANQWTAGITGDFYKFYNGSQAEVWHQPAVRLKADIMVIPVQKLTLTAYLSVLGGIHARDASWSAVTLTPVVDLGLNGEYQIVRRLSAFVQFSNLLNKKYERWSGYEAYGLNVYGGLRLKF